MFSLIGNLSGLRQRLHRSVIPVATTLTTLFALAQPLVAQTESSLATGARVRVVIPAVDGQSKRYVPGELVRLAGDTVVLLTGWGTVGPDTLVYALGEGGGRRLERLTGRHGHRGTGVALGTAFGALAGGLIGAATWRPCTPQGSDACLFSTLISNSSREMQAAEGVLLGALGGALAGLVIGAVVRTETWEPLRTSGIRLGIAPGAVRISLPF